MRQAADEMFQLTNPLIFWSWDSHDPPEFCRGFGSILAGAATWLIRISGAVVWVDVRSFISEPYEPDLQAKCVDALAGVRNAQRDDGASLALTMIGQAPAQARGLVTKHAFKQVTVCSATTDVEELAAPEAAAVLGNTPEAVKSRLHRAPAPQ